MEIPLPWERLLWSGRSLSLRRRHYALTDFRLAGVGRDSSAEIALCDIGGVRRVASWVERLAGVSTLVVRTRHGQGPTLVLRRIRRGEQLAALLQLLAAEPGRAPTPDVVRAALSSTPWRTRSGPVPSRTVLAGVTVVLAAVFGVAIGLQGHSAPVVYPPDDAIYPGGEKRTREEIVRFMEAAVLPWAREALGPLVGGSHRVTCDTCHGREAAQRDWRMPGVIALPQPSVAEHGWERYSSRMDAQMRNAIYGYVAESDNHARAAYMRGVIMPGMARLLGRPAYDFTRPYEYNRTHFTFGCYHCHRVQ